MKTIKYFIALTIAASTSFAQDENPFKNLDYPELQVAPRATERLEQMAKIEADSAFLNQWPMFTSGLLTLTAGLMINGNYLEGINDTQEKKDADMAANTAAAVGAGWVAVASYLALKRPISSGLSDIRKISSKDKRGELSRERLAEEVLEYTARRQSTLDSLAMFTNFAASVYVTSKANENSRVYGYLAIASSVLPWIFPTMYELNYNKHLEYKRKIYAPLVNLQLHSSGTPMMNLSWNF